MMKKFLAILCFACWIIICVLTLVLTIFGETVSPIMALCPSAICVMHYGMILWDMCHETE